MTVVPFACDSRDTISISGQDSMMALWGVLGLVTLSAIGFYAYNFNTFGFRDHINTILTILGTGYATKVVGAAAF